MNKNLVPTGFNGVLKLFKFVRTTAEPGFPTKGLVHVVPKLVAAAPVVHKGFHGMVQHPIPFHWQVALGKTYIYW